MPPVKPAWQNWPQGSQNTLGMPPSDRHRPQYCELKAKRGKERTESSKSGIMSERKKRRNFLVYRLRQMDVDDKICEQIGPGVLEKIYPTEVIEQCVQGTDHWTPTHH